MSELGYRLEVTHGGQIARLFQTNEDGTETEIHDVISLDLSIDADRKGRRQPMTMMTIRTLGPVNVTAPLEVVRWPVAMHADEV